YSILQTLSTTTTSSTTSKSISTARARPRLTTITNTPISTFSSSTLLQSRAMATAATNSNSTHQPKPATRHFLSIADLTPAELKFLVNRSHAAKAAIKAGNIQAELKNKLQGKTVALMFSKRS